MISVRILQKMERYGCGVKRDYWNKKMQKYQTMDI